MTLCLREAIYVYVWDLSRGNVFLFKLFKLKRLKRIYKSYIYDAPWREEVNARKLLFEINAFKVMHPIP